MNPQKFNQNVFQSIAIALLVPCVIATSAVVFRYSGTIDLKFGGDGGHLKIQGNPQAEVAAKSVPVKKQ